MLISLATLIGLVVLLAGGTSRAISMNRGHRSVWLAFAIASAAACDRGAPPGPVAGGPALSPDAAPIHGVDAVSPASKPKPEVETEPREPGGREPEPHASTSAELRLREVAPSERGAVTAVVVRIRRGGPFPYDKDGSVFRNAERRLPLKPLGFYREYTVPTPGERTRGARRVVAGKSGELYYTADHYRSFVRIDEGTP